jgi:L-ascorbate metabolism protein UlaG (beta-lactamase superfamily)
MPQTSSSPRNTLTITWLGHSAFRFDSPGGTGVLIDPWLENPKAPPGALRQRDVKLILVTHGHGDHIGNTVELARANKADVVAIHEVSLYLKKRGVANVTGMNKSGSVTLHGITATMVDAKHSSGIDTEEVVIAGADPAGFVVRFENGTTIYHAGDTGVFLDMKLIAELYAPSVVILPIGGLYTMGPREAAKACELLDPAVIIGMHYGTFPPLAGTPAQLREALPPAMRDRVQVLEPGVPFSLP